MSLPHWSYVAMLAFCLALPYLAMAVSKTVPSAHPARKPFVPRPHLVPA